MDALKSLVQPLVGGSSSSLIDGAKLVVLGGTVETARRVSSSAWSSFVNSFFLTAHFSEEDYPYDWLMLWLSKRPEWQRSREFETTTRTVTPGSSLDNSFGDEDDETAGEQDDELIPGKNKTRVVFQPTFDTTHTIYYRGHWLRIRRSHLLKNKSRPEAAAEGAAAWVVSEREMRERLKREREARELKEKLDRERRRKELIEKEKKEKEEEKKKEAEEKKKEAEEKKKEEREEREKAKREEKEAKEEKEREEKEKSDDEEKQSEENDDEEESGTENDENASSSWVKADD
ncbi:hypothetical protein BD410DRAFT_804019 [Rickenella mellea]|uniref:BCS1 N-terminal domain-containing protein n=1 Tax=Rickenella mellea TaxID=50990 RepID=A0A4Y7Q2G7_9AGAM|nr:hypothetical protein BD410DRAFT_804019 [Rickenella mellea]